MPSFSFWPDEVTSNYRSNSYLHIWHLSLLSGRDRLACFCLGELLVTWEKEARGLS